MPRRPRIQLAGIPQHLVQRGVNREPCFFAEEGYHCYPHWPFEAAADWRCAIHAYVLMSNHVHLPVCEERESIDYLDDTCASVTGEFAVWYGKSGLAEYERIAGFVAALDVMRR